MIGFAYHRMKKIGEDEQEVEDDGSKNSPLFSHAIKLFQFIFERLK